MHTYTHSPAVEGIDSDDTSSPVKIRNHHKTTARTLRTTSSDSSVKSTHDTPRATNRSHKIKSRDRSLATPQVSSLKDDQTTKSKLLTEAQRKNRPENHKRDSSSMQVRFCDICCTAYN